MKIQKYKKYGCLSLIVTMNKDIFVKPKWKISLATTLALIFFCVTVPKGYGSSDINPSSFDWSTVPDTEANRSTFPIMDSDGNLGTATTKHVKVTTGWDSTHCKTRSGTLIDHTHYQFDFSGSSLTDSNRLWDWYYASEPDITVSGNSTNKRNCLAYTLDGNVGSANYDYWIIPGTGSHGGNKAFTDDLDTYSWPSPDVEADDWLAYNATGQTKIIHASMVMDIGGGEPIELQWKNSSSPTCNFGNSDADNVYSTPDCDITYAVVGEPPEGTWEPDYYEGTSSTCTAYYD